MADDQDDSGKTEEPTQKKLDEAYKKGDVAKSQELPTLFILFGAMLVILIGSGPLMFSLAKSLQGIFANAADIPVDGGHLRVLLLQMIKAILIAVALPFMAFVVCGLAGHVIQHRFVWSTEPIIPKFSKVSPLAGLKRMFSSQSLVNFTKGLVKIAVVGIAIFYTLWPERDRFDTLIKMDPASVLPVAHGMLLDMLTSVMIAMAFIAALDFFYQHRKWYNRQRMSVRELKDEYKNQEGNPEIKAKLRQIRRERARKRMMSEVPKAAVVITNPTHFAIALQYEKGMAAPLCVAKGTDNIALKIKEVAREHNIAVIENKPLARTLYATVEIGEEIPPEHYKAVAQIIGYVMGLKAKKRWRAA
ncbi:MAG: flagellar biosynthesis protein FlhB [Pseudomonadota bacterium]